MVTVGNGEVPGQADGLALVLATVSVCVHSFTLLIHLIPAKREREKESERKRRRKRKKKRIRQTVIDWGGRETNIIWSMTRCSRISRHIESVWLCTSKLCVSSNLDEQVAFSQTCEKLSKKYSTHFVMRMMIFKIRGFQHREEKLVSGQAFWSFQCFNPPG